MPFLHLNQVEEREIRPGCHVRFVHSATMTFAHWDFDPDAEIPDHAHPHEQVATMIEGELDLTIDGETRRMTRGCVAIIPSNARHSCRARTRVHVIDAFYPIREDYR